MGTVPYLWSFSLLFCEPLCLTLPNKSKKSVEKDFLLQKLCWCFLTNSHQSFVVLNYSNICSPPPTLPQSHTPILTHQDNSQVRGCVTSLVIQLFHSWICVGLSGDTVWSWAFLTVHLSVCPRNSPSDSGAFIESLTKEDSSTGTSQDFSTVRTSA